MKEKLSIAANVAIIIALGVVLFSPSGIAGSWAVARYDDWQDRRLIADMWPLLTQASSRLRSPTDDSERTIVEFIDYECPSCRGTSSAIASSVEDQGVTVIVRHLPLTSIHARARGAAVTAVCAERHGLFVEAHEVLLDDAVWTEGGSWADLAASVGPLEAEELRACVDGKQADDRLAEDAELAASLGIVGTPTFVTRRGIFLGAEGWEQAVASLPPLNGRQQEASRRIVSDDVEFSSLVHADLKLAEIGKLKTALFLGEDRLLIVDGPWLHFVDVGSDSVQTRGGAGGGPGEFRTIFEILRSPSRIVVRDFALSRLTTFSYDGTLRDTRQYDPLALESMLARAVAAFPDGAVIFRDSRAVDRWPDGRSRATVRYVELDREGRDTVVAEALGAEEFGYRYNDGRRGVDRVILGHDTLEGQIGERLVVAQTDARTVRVHDRNGRIVAEIPMPPPVRASASQIERAREARIAGARGMEIPAEIREAFGISSDRRDSKEEVYRAAPANDAAPPIDKLLVDLNGRLWIRQFLMPDGNVVRWQVWDVAHVRLESIVEFDREARLLDADKNRLLLHYTDSFGVDRVEIREMVTASDNS